MTEYDLDTAKAMFKTQRYLYVGFMCHLTIEKALKAIIANIDEEQNPPRIHHLVKLARTAKIYDSLSEEQKSLLEKLMPLHIEARYSPYKDNIAMQLDEAKSKKILEETGELLCWIKKQL